MATYLADTHTIVWYLAGSPQLGVAARQVIDEAVRGNHQVHIPAIVLAEIIMLIEKRHIVTDMSQLFASLSSTTGFRLTSLTPEVVVDIQRLTVLPDIHDRLIVAEAIKSGAGLITCDQVIIASNLVPVVW